MEIIQKETSTAINYCYISAALRASLFHSSVLTACYIMGSNFPNDIFSLKPQSKNTFTSI